MNFLWTSYVLTTILQTVVAEAPENYRKNFCEYHKNACHLKVRLRAILSLSGVAPLRDQIASLA
jgi:hypothetical protein